MLCESGHQLTDCDEGTSGMVRLQSVTDVAGLMSGRNLQVAAEKLAAASQRAAEALAARANGGLKEFMHVLRISPRPSEAGGSSAATDFELVEVDGSCM
jgi:hypothetical protein